jgi:hypothetical protein
MGLSIGPKLPHENVRKQFVASEDLKSLIQRYVKPTIGATAIGAVTVTRHITILTGPEWRVNIAYIGEQLRTNYRIAGLTRPN